MKDTHPKIRALLLAHPDGLTPRQMIEADPTLPAKVDNVHRTMRRMPDVYIDRWIRGRGRGGSQPVFVAVPIPEDCPKPEPFSNGEGEARRAARRRAATAEKQARQLMPKQNWIAK